MRIRGRGASTASAWPRTSIPRGRQGSVLARSSITIAARPFRLTSRNFFVPFELTPLMETLARVNPVSYVIEGLRSLVIEGWDLDKLAACIGVIVLMGIALTGLSLRAIATYDR